MRINWQAVLMHCGAAALACTIAAAIMTASGGRPLWGALIMWPVVSVFYVLREAWTAADRHDTTWSDGWAIVLSGEPGWSPWNLRLQAFAPVLAGLIVVLIAGSM